MTHPVDIHPDRGSLESVWLVACLSLLACGCSGAAVPRASDARADAASDTEATDLASPEDTSSPRREVGVACRTPSDCVRQADCIGSPRGGYRCMRRCSELGSGRICDDGSVCTPVQNSASVCYTGGWRKVGERCNSNLECRPGSLCVGLEGTGRFFCLEACHRLDGGCGEGYHCRSLKRGRGEGICRRNVGAACDYSRECHGDLTCTSEGPSISNRFPRGYCTQSGCRSNDDCPEGSRCRQLPNTEAKICLAECDRDIDCRLSGRYTCLDDETCAQSDDPEACRSFREGVSLCVPPGLTLWPEGM